MTLYLSRLSLSRAPSVQALGSLIDPDEAGRREDAHHRLLWSAFAGDPEAKRDFLWRAEGRGVFTVLSPRPPAESPLFEPPETRDFTPDLAPGDRLAFVLRVNATRTVKSDDMAPNGKPRRKHRDIVMDALFAVKEGRAGQRMVLARQAAESWLAGQGTRHGFAVEDVAVQDYSVRALPMHRGRRRNQPQFGILDLSGTVRVEDPALFLTKLAAGFGRAKAFGCGLMLVRRA
jgi:CRISPR system Cascade subunit CasE